MLVVMVSCRIVCFWNQNNSYFCCLKWFNMKYDIFISYSRYDSDVVNELVALLEQEGYSVWIDRVGIDNGDDFKRVILKAIKESSIVLFFSSAHSNVSDWITKEIGIAVKYKKHIIPLKIDDSNFNEAVEFDLINLDYVDYSEKSTRLAMSERLLKTLRNKLGKGFGEIASKAKEQTEREWHEKERICEALFADMAADIMKYKAYVMKVLFGKVPSTEEMRDQDCPMGHFLKAGLTLNFEDLYDRGLLPVGNRVLETAIFKEDFEVPQISVREFGEVPIGRNDLYFIGCEGSGKSCVLAGILNYLHNEGKMQFVPARNAKGYDVSLNYYKALIRSVEEFKVPCLSPVDAIGFIQFNLGLKFEHEVTAMELSGESFRLLSEADYTRHKVWEMIGLGCCLNDNSKTLFFLVDFSIIIGKNSMHSNIEQNQMMDIALDMFSSDGINGEKNCTMSKVKTIAIVVTKSDLIDVELGRPLTLEERDRIASDYLSMHCPGVIKKLSNLCRKYDINAFYKGHVHQPYVLTFSLGRFFVGNTVVFDSRDSKRLAEFVMTVTDKHRAVS